MDERTMSPTAILASHEREIVATMPLPLSGDAATQTPGAWLSRFSYTERWLHWINSAAFLFLALTGLGIYVHAFEDAANHLIARLPGFLAHFELVDFHVLAAMVFILNPLLWFAFGDRRALVADARGILHFDADDRAWLTRIVTFRRPLPPQGQFNAAQKLSAIGLVFAWVCFIATGLMQMQWPLFNHPARGGAPDAAGVAGAPGAGVPMPGAGGAGPGSITTGPFGIFHFNMAGMQTVHTVHELVALICVIWLAAHIYMSTLNRTTRHSLWGMTMGRVRRDWAVAHHAKWVAAVEGPDSQQAGDDAPHTFMRNSSREANARK